MMFVYFQSWKQIRIHQYDSSNLTKHISFVPSSMWIKAVCVPRMIGSSLQFTPVEISRASSSMHFALYPATSIIVGRDVQSSFRPNVTYDGNLGTIGIRLLTPTQCRISECFSEGRCDSLLNVFVTRGIAICNNPTHRINILKEKMMHIT